MTVDNIWAKIRGLNDDGFLDTMAMLGGKLIWVDGVNGDDANYAQKDSPIKTLDGTDGALARATAGKHDVIVIKGDGTKNGSTVVLDAALDWNKNCVHMIAQTPVRGFFSPRARIAPTLATTAFANFFTLSAKNCMFRNIQIVPEFTTGHASSIALTITGERNHLIRCHIAGMVDAASGAGSGARCVKFSGDGENLLEECVVGVDTIDRSAANASVEFTSHANRNLLLKCYFPIRATATSPLLVKADTMDRFNVFEDCVVWNHGTSTIAGLCTIAAASGGYVAFIRPSVLRNITGFGTNATSQGQIYITGPTDGSTVSGIGYNPSA